MTLTETPPSVVDSGNDSGGLEPGPRFVPKMENSEPCAMEPAGKPAGMKLAALMMPRGAISCAEPSAAVARTARMTIAGFSTFSSLRLARTDS